MDVEEIALAALATGKLRDLTWSSFGAGDAHAVAMDVDVDVAAVLVVRRYRNDDWSVDATRFVREHGEWIGLGSGGGTLATWPPRFDDDADIGPTFTGWSALDDDGVLSVAGFSHGPIENIELIWSGGVRSVRVGPAHAFVVAVRTDEDEDFDALELRGLSADGVVLVNTGDRRAAERQARGLTVADALRAPNGSEVNVEATLLVVAGQPVLLCDEIDCDPPRPKGPSIRLDFADDAPIPLTEFGDGWVAPLMAQVSGVIADGVLTPLPSSVVDL